MPRVFTLLDDTTKSVETYIDRFFVPGESMYSLLLLILFFYSCHAEAGRSRCLHIFFVCVHRGVKPKKDLKVETVSDSQFFFSNIKITSLLILACSIEKRYTHTFKSNVHYHEYD